MLWTVLDLPNSYAEVANPSISEYDVFEEKAFKEVVKLKRGPLGGVLIQ